MGRAWTLSSIGKCLLNAHVFSQQSSTFLDNFILQLHTLQVSFRERAFYIHTQAHRKLYLFIVGRYLGYDLEKIYVLLKNLYPIFLYVD